MLYADISYRKKKQIRERLSVLKIQKFNVKYV